MGGLSRSTMDVVAVLDAMGFDVVMIETVGVGQDEIDIVSSAQTAIVVTVPGLGDDIQAIKAGILEIADVLVVNKADREGADRAVRDLMHMLELRDTVGPGAGRAEAADQGAQGRAVGERLGAPPLEGARPNRQVALPDSGIDELVAAIERHRAKTTGEAGAERARRRAAAQLLELVKDRLADAALAVIDARGGLDQAAGDVAARRRDPYGVADEIVGAVLAGSPPGRKA
jgi:LAO/AO transport system kinase